LASRSTAVRPRRAARTVAALVALVVVGQGSLVATLRLGLAGPSPAATDRARFILERDRGRGDAPVLPGILGDTTSSSAAQAAEARLDPTAGLEPTIRFEDAERHGEDHIAALTRRIR
jgi:hypothetical protein